MKRIRVKFNGSDNNDRVFFLTIPEGSTFGQIRDRIAYVIGVKSLFIRIFQELNTTLHEISWNTNSDGLTEIGVEVLWQDYNRASSNRIDSPNMSAGASNCTCLNGLCNLDCGCNSFRYITCSCQGRCQPLNDLPVITTQVQPFETARKTSGKRRRHQRKYQERKDQERKDQERKDQERKDQERKDQERKDQERTATRKIDFIKRKIVERKEERSVKADFRDWIVQNEIEPLVQDGTLRLSERVHHQNTAYYDCELCKLKLIRGGIIGAAEHIKSVLHKNQLLVERSLVDDGIENLRLQLIQSVQQQANRNHIEGVNLINSVEEVLGQQGVIIINCQ